VTDARGASATYNYNGRRLITGISFITASGVANTPNVSFYYDSAANRTLMIDGMGNRAYSYDQLSRLTSEVRSFNGVGTFTLSYGYNLAGELTSISDPFGQAVSNGFDSTGRLHNVGASGFPNVSQFASNIQYRASGSMKDLTYGNGTTLTVGYNSRLQPTSYQIPNILNKSYEYFADGALKHAGDLIDGRYDRAMQYDHAGRLAAAQTGTEARGGATADGPFNQTFQYDAFDHTTARTSRQWTTTYTDSGSYQNERHNGWIYDADGNVLSNSDVQFTYNAEGLPAQTVNLLGGSINSNSFDGDGQRIQSAYQLNQSSSATTKYYLRATPLGGKIVADILSSGQKVQGYVYAGDSLLAVEKLPVTGDSSSYVVWRHEEPSGSVRGSDPSGGQNWATELHSAEQDATGVDMKAEDPGPSPLYQPADQNSPDPLQSGNPTRLTGGCKFNNMPIADCGFLMKGIAFNEFTLVEAASESSKPKLRNYEVSYYHGRLTRDFGLDVGKALNQALEEGNLTRNWIVNDSSVATFTAPPTGQQPQPQKPVGSRTPYVDQKVLNSCTEDYFGVTLKRFDESRRGHNGSFTGMGPSYLPGNPNGEGGTATYTMTNSVDYSNKELKKMATEWFGGAAPEPGKIIVGFELPGYPLRNYTGSDNSPMQMIMTQVHELGHSLDEITQIGYDRLGKHPGRPDLGGRILEDCVRKRGGFRWR
jgi:hypothetical protein